MSDEDADAPGADRALRGDELPLGERARLRIDDARDLYPVHQRDHQRHDPEARVEKRREHDRKEQGGERHHQIGKAHQRHSGDAAEESGRDSDNSADRDCDAVRDDADDQ